MKKLFSVYHSCSLVNLFMKCEFSCLVTSVFCNFTECYEVDVACGSVFFFFFEISGEEMFTGPQERQNALAWHVWRHRYECVLSRFDIKID